MPVDPAMPRNLAKRRKNAGYGAICAVGFDADPDVFRLDATEDVERHMYKLQPGTWHVLHFVRLIWTPGIEAARTIVTSAETFLTDTKHHLGQHWYQAPLDLLDDLILAGAASLHSPTWTNADLIVRLRAEANREADRYAAGIF